MQIRGDNVILPQVGGLPASGPAEAGKNSGCLLGPFEPPAYEVLNGRAQRPVLLACDHASNRVPIALQDLGLPESSLNRHIAIDIGAANVTRFLSRMLDATAVLCNYSRLVIDCNRAPNDPTSIMALSDGEWIPGNQDLSDSDRARRYQEIHQPYHRAIDGELKRLHDPGIWPALISVHSFTPFFDQVHRPWEVGVLWDADPRIAIPLMEKLAARGVAVGDNQPYSGKHPADHTMDHHAELDRLAHVSIEIRQDLISDAEGVNGWARCLGEALGEILEDRNLYSLYQPGDA
jgi:predicted N-formylglutamate amidohydrolase